MGKAYATVRRCKGELLKGGIQWVLEIAEINRLEWGIVPHYRKGGKDFFSGKPTIIPNSPAKTTPPASRGFSVGALQNQPNTAYGINTWESMEQFEAFSGADDLKEAMGAAGVLKAPTVIILNEVGKG